MHYHSNLMRFIILAPILPDLVILFLLFRRKLAKELFWFASYLFFCVLFLPVLFAVYETGDPDRYFYASWLYNGLTLILAFMVILEVYRNVLLGYPAIQRLTVVFVVTIGLLLVGVGIYVGKLGSPNSIATVEIMLVIERSVRIIQIGLIVSLFAFVSLMGLNWKNYIFGIALGCGLYAAANMAVTAVAVEVLRTAYVMVVVDQFAYLGMLAIWVIYVRQPEPARQILFPPSARQDLERWNNALTDVLAR